MSRNNPLHGEREAACPRLPPGIGGPAPGLRGASNPRGAGQVKGGEALRDAVGARLRAALAPGEVRAAPPGGALCAVSVRLAALCARFLSGSRRFVRDFCPARGAGAAWAPGGDAGCGRAAQACAVEACSMELKEPLLADALPRAAQAAVHPARARPLAMKRRHEASP